jgi:hypothetical protein
MYLLGHIGIQFNALLLPLIVLQLTGSISLAGVAMFVAWLPKLVLYVSGGSFVQRFSAARVHLLLEGVRSAALLALLACVLLTGPFWVIALATVAYQCAGAVWHIIFERLVTAWWPAAERVHGHARMIQHFHVGCIAALCLGLLVHSTAQLLGIALVLQLGMLIWVLRSRTQIHSAAQVPVATATAGLLGQLCADVRAFWHRALIQYAAMTFLLSLPYSMLCAGIVFYLDRAQPGASADAAWPSALMLVRTAAGLITMLFVRRLLARAQGETLLVRLGLITVTLGGVGLLIDSSVWLLCLAAAAVSVSAHFCTPLARAGRQQLIVMLVPQPSRTGVTGIMTAAESTSNAAAALALVALGENLGLLSAIATALGLIGVVQLYALVLKRPASSVAH